MANSLSSSERDAAFPVHVDLGRKEDAMNMATERAPSGKKAKSRVYYPTLYIENVEGLPALPKEGCILVKFRRKSMRVEENMDGKETAGVTLEIQSLCLPEDMAGEDDGDMESAMKEFAKGNGVDTGPAEPDDDDNGGESDDDGDEE